MEFFNENIIKSIRLLISAISLTAVIVIGFFALVFYQVYIGPLPNFSAEKQIVSSTYSVPSKPKIDLSGVWLAPDFALIDQEENGEQIAYGKDLIANTSYYFGPKGVIGHTSNGMNCQNCHLNAGTTVFGNNYGAVAATYPRIRPRSGLMEDIPKRVNDCFERSLNGSALEVESDEMKAIVAYMEWLGKDTPKGITPKGTGIYQLAYLDRAADPISGKNIYDSQCQLCHGADGQGKINGEGNSYTYPPLWGENSYNKGAGLFRLSRFAGYVYTSMPLGASASNPILTEEQAWDVAAYINSLDRPNLDISKDWPDISKKPIDHPFGPFSDSFSEEQHKYGPFIEIIASRKK
jgi:thiosulfate dehydrogenase